MTALWWWVSLLLPFSLNCRNCCSIISIICPYPYLSVFPSIYASDKRYQVQSLCYMEEIKRWSKTVGFPQLILPPTIPRRFSAIWFLLIYCKWRKDRLGPCRKIKLCISPNELPHTGTFKIEVGNTYLDNQHAIDSGLQGPGLMKMPQISNRNEIFYSMPCHKNCM